MTLDEMSSQITGMFDVPTATAQGYVNEAYRQFVTDTEWLTATITLATTVAGTATYAIDATIVDIRSVFVNGVEYMRAGEWDIPDLNNGTAFLPRNVTGAFSQTSDANGNDQLVLYPTPTQSGLVVSGKVEKVPVDLVTGTGAGSSPIVSTDLHSAILNKAIGIAYLRVDELGYMSQYYDAYYQEGVQKAQGRKRKRVSGHGPFRVRVQGFDW